MLTSYYRLAAYLDKKNSKSNEAYESKKERLRAKISTDITTSYKSYDVGHAETLETLNEAVHHSLEIAFEKENSPNSCSEGSSTGACESSKRSQPTTEYKGLDYFDDGSESDSSDSEASQSD